MMADTSRNETSKREQVIALVEALFQDEAEAERWLATYNHDLCATPMDFLETDNGCDQVMATLRRIKHRQLIR